MCTVSWVGEQFEPVLPDFEPYQPYQPSRTSPVITTPQITVTGLKPDLDLEELKRLIDRFRELVKVAEKIDAHLGQPDCVDPEKAKLMERVKQLEALLAIPPEFVIAKGGNVKPGTYRVIDGKLYKVIE